MANPDTLGLAALPRELSALTGKPSPSYRQLYNMTLNGRLPAEQVNGRYQPRRADLPAIAISLGLMPADNLVAA